MKYEAIEIAFQMKTREKYCAESRWTESENMDHSEVKRPSVKQTHIDPYEVIEYIQPCFFDALTHAPCEAPMSTG